MLKFCVEQENVQQELNCLAQSICLRQRDKIMELQKRLVQYQRPDKEGP